MRGIRGAALLVFSILVPAVAPAQWKIPAEEPPKVIAKAKVCSSNSDCDKKDYCDTTPGCAPVAMGTCKKRPLACQPGGITVAGCDGKTYAGSCRASAEGVSVKGN